MQPWHAPSSPGCAHLVLQGQRALDFVLSNKVSHTMHLAHRGVGRCRTLAGIVWAPMAMQLASAARAQRSVLTAGASPPHRAHALFGWCCCLQGMIDKTLLFDIELIRVDRA